MAELRNNDGTRWDWDKGTAQFGPCFPRRISWGDLDGEIEINGRFLVVEGKRNQQSVVGGQKYAMDARVRDGRTVFVVYGDPPLDIRAMQFYPEPERHEATWQTFWQACREWASWASAQPQSTPRRACFCPTFAMRRQVALR